MKEADIRPDELMREHARLRAADVEELMARRGEFVAVPCPACEAAPREAAFEKAGFSFINCEACGTLFVNPRPTPQMLEEFYTSSASIKFWNDRIFPASDDARRASILASRAARVAELCRKHGAPVDVLLDAGAGFGTFCEEMIKTGAFGKVIAVEPSPDLAETCCRKGLDVIESPIEKVKLDAVSVVTSFELIEHLFRPEEFIRGCASVLPAEGLFVVTTPNIRGFDLSVLGRLSDNVDGPNHLNYFHTGSLAALLARCGFEVLEALTPGKLDAELVRKKILAGELDVSGRPFLEEVLIKRWDELGASFQDFLAASGLSSHLWIVARKSG